MVHKFGLILNGASLGVSLLTVLLCQGGYRRFGTAHMIFTAALIGWKLGA